MTLTSCFTPQQQPNCKQSQQLAQIVPPILPVRLESESILSRDLIIAIRSLDPHNDSSLYHKAEVMDLGGWNFDPSMLSSLAWNDNNIEAVSEGGEKDLKKGKTESKATSSTRSSPARLDSTNWVGNLSLLSNFGELDYDGGGCSQQSKSSDNDRDGGDTSQSLPAHDAETARHQSKLPRETNLETHTVSEAQSVNSGIKGGGTSSVATGTSSGTSNMASIIGATQLHPMAIQSSATCPPHSSAANNGPMLSNTQTNSYLQMSTGGMMTGQNHQAPSDIFGLQGIDSAALASLAAAFQSQSDTNHNNNHHISTLAANFMLATQTKSTDSSHTLSESHQPQPQHRSGPSTLPSQPHTGSVSSAPQLGRQHRQQPKNTASSKPPPFYLFDAPVELRANFMQNQRKLGLPIQHDPNSYHYGETVKGFHPQSLMNQQQLNSLTAPSQVNQVPDAPVQLIDARHGNIRTNFSGRVKNEREQKRAQKITELIEQLRLDMEKGGCKVEMRSKFHTLSQCADYVKHLIKTTKEKEEAIDKLKTDLEVKKRKIEEEKSAQESRSDPESVTSSLTSDTNSSLRHSRSQQPPSKKMKATTNDHGGDNQQDNTTSYHNMSSVSTNEDSSGGGDGSGNGSGSGEPSAQGLSTDKTDATGVSDLTDSNRASSSNNSGSGANSGKTESVSRDQLQENGEQFQPSSSSISSDAAVASVRSIHDRQTEEHLHNHKDVVFNQHGKRQHRKRPTDEVTSLEPNFGLDYEEVFTMSNVPQLIATTSGKIVTWNKCFLKLTGIRRSEIERMTIFSLVKPEKLSNFFEIVAHALKPSLGADTKPETGTTENVSEPKPHSGEGSSTSSTRSNYAAMTLPCVNFPAMRKRRDTDHSHPATQVHVTVTLMSDEDPRKRCFHCVFSNCVGTNGTLGILTPDLLASLFAAPEPSHKKSRRHQQRGDNKYTRTRHHDKTLRDETKSEQDMMLEDKQKDEINAEEAEGDASDMEALTNQLDAFRGELA